MVMEVGQVGGLTGQVLALKHEVRFEVGDCFFNFWWGFFEFEVGFNVQLGVVVAAFRVSRRVQFEVMCPAEIFSEALEGSVDACRELGSLDAEVETQSQQ